MPKDHSSTTQSIAFRLSMSAEQYKAYYQGAVKFIQVQSNDGRNIRFPANAVRKFLTADGIYGDFEIQFDAHNKLVGVIRSWE